MKDFEFIYDPEEQRRKKKFPKQFGNINLLLDDSTVLIKNLDIKNKYIKKDIEALNSNTIKNMTYSGMEVPSRWKVKQNYSKSMMKIMNNDKCFTEYLMKKETRDEVYKNYLKDKNIKEENISQIPTQVNSFLENTVLSKTKYSLLNNTITTSNGNFKDKFSNYNNRNITGENFNKTFLSKEMKEIKEKEENLTNRNYFNQTIGGNLGKTTAYNNTSDLNITNYNLTNESFIKKNRQNSFFVGNETENNISLNQTQNVNKTTLTQIDELNRSQISFNKFIGRMKRKEPIKVGNLLHVDYSSFFKRNINIKNKELRELWDEIDHYGPKFAHCNTCFNKNLDFFENVNQKDGLNIISYIKQNRNQFNSRSRSKSKK